MCDMLVCWFVWILCGILPVTILLFCVMVFVFDLTFSLGLYDLLIVSVLHACGGFFSYTLFVVLWAIGFC